MAMRGRRCVSFPRWGLYIVFCDGYELRPVEQGERMRSERLKHPSRSRKSGAPGKSRKSPPRKRVHKPVPQHTETALLEALQRTASGSTDDFFRALVVDLTRILRTLSTLVDESATSVLSAFAARADRELERITTHKKREDQLRSSLEEKETLLKEVHHRVKNNLQVITSLLNLQASGVQDPDVITMLQESQNRVRSIALVHDRLHRSSSLMSIDFGEYIRTMASQLMRSYAKGGVAVSLDVEPIHVGIDTAIPCGLLLNELLSNAVRHAFPDGRTGTISIGLAHTPEQKVKLTVADDGIGLPPGMDWRNAQTMGMMLIVGLSQQLGGALDVAAADGTMFTVTFPLE
jgi:two-component sensor histidine kinase